jgi:hypothetical protein
VSLKLLPINIEFKDWACQIRVNFPGINIPLPPDDIKDWRSWASQAIYSNGLFDVPVPTELAYPNTEDWRAWASYFINTLSS